MGFCLKNLNPPKIIKMKQKITQELINNKKAYYDYDILETKKAGIVLTGSEVKSLRSGKGSLKGSYGMIKNNEVYLINFHISPYQINNLSSKDNPERDKKLLLKKSEILRLKNRIKQEHLTLIPLRVYNDTNGLIKVDLALAKKKKKFDKRLKIKTRENKKRIEKAKKGNVWG